MREVNLNATDPPVSHFLGCVCPTSLPTSPLPLFPPSSQTGDPTSTGVTSEAGPEAHLVIWGTDVNVQDTKKRFREFLEKFIDDLPGEGGESPMDRAEPYYMQRLEEVCLVNT